MRERAGGQRGKWAIEIVLKRCWMDKKCQCMTNRKLDIGLYMLYRKVPHFTLNPPWPLNVDSIGAPNAKPTTDNSVDCDCSPIYAVCMTIAIINDDSKHVETSAIDNYFYLNTHTAVRPQYDTGFRSVRRIWSPYVMDACSRCETQNAWYPSAEESQSFAAPAINLILSWRLFVCATPKPQHAH